MLEAQNHAFPLFSTLTYEEVPYGSSLRKTHLTACIHRLREAARRRGIQSVRYFGIGEYGEQFGRPHYHTAIFGLPAEGGDLVDAAWQSRDYHGPGEGRPGTTDHHFLDPGLAGYITGYISKSMTSKEDKRLDGREPEFAVMSRRPGIGSTSLEPLIEALNTSAGSLYIARNGDVPNAFNVGGRMLPIGPHLRGLLRLFFFGESTTPQSAKDKHNRDFEMDKLAQVDVFTVPAGTSLRELQRFAHEVAPIPPNAHAERLAQKARKVSARLKIKQSMRKI